MMIHKMKSKPALFRITLVALPLCAIIALGWAFLSQKETQIGINLSDFREGTIVNYRIKSDGDLVEEASKHVKNDGKMSLPVPREIVSSKDNENIEYEIDVKSPENESEQTSAQALKLLLNLNKKTGDISLSANGIEESTSLTLKTGQSSKNLSADWAGQFSASSLKDVLGQSGIKNDEMIQFAFQSANIANDIDSVQTGKMDVLFTLFGDSSGSSVSTVQGNYSSSMAQMARELSAIMSMQTFIIGKFFDARIQLATQRKIQELQARAHKDYHPSDQMCRIGTFVRSIAHAESKSELDKKALNRILLNQYLGMQNSTAAGTAIVNNEAKRFAFARKYCDPKDAGGALEQVCEGADVGNIVDIDRKNKDIDYSRTLALPLTLQIDFTDTTATNDEEDIIALSKNLYFPKAFQFSDGGGINKRTEPHYDSRSFASKMSVAHSTFINIVGMKSSAPEGQPTTATATSPPPGPMGTGSILENVMRDPPVTGPMTPLRTTRDTPTVLAEDSGWAYMKAMMREFGVTNDAEIDQILGERPSYYAQMEVLTKKIYQHPNFYTNLYDKPTNVKRIGAAIDAITIMNQRDRFESHLRHEMLSAVLLEEELKRSAEDVNSQIQESIGQIAQGDR